MADPKQFYCHGGPRIITAEDSGDAAVKYVKTLVNPTGRTKVVVVGEGHKQNKSICEWEEWVKLDQVVTTELVPKVKV